MAEPLYYEPAPEVAEIAGQLIVDHHPRLSAAPIVYVFRSVAQKSRGKHVLAKARRVTGLSSFLVALAGGEVDVEDPLADYTFFVMEVAYDRWLTADLEQRVALVDHELCHFAIDDETGEMRILPHDLEEFIAVVARHGQWSPDVAAFADVCATVA